MKKSMFFLFVLLAIAGLSMTGCDPQPVEVTNWDELSGGNVSVGNVTLTATTDNAKKYILRWDAVEGDYGYYVVARQQGKKTVLSSSEVYASGVEIGEEHNGFPAKATDGTEDTSGTFDTDKYWALVDVTYFQANDIPTGTVWEIGVRTGSNVTWASTKITKAAP
jgi:hypothetical protein